MLTTNYITDFVRDYALCEGVDVVAFDPAEVLAEVYDHAHALPVGKYDDADENYLESISLALEVVVSRLLGI